MTAPDVAAITKTAREKRAEARAVGQERRVLFSEAQRMLDRAAALERRERSLRAEADDAEQTAREIAHREHPNRRGAVKRWEREG